MADELSREWAWQPIESVPKDGTPFWAYGESLIDLDFNPKGIVEACFDGERLIGAVWNGQSDIWNTLPIEPTHWRPFPDSPAALPAPPPEKALPPAIREAVDRVKTELAIQADMMLPDDDGHTMVGDLRLLLDWIALAASSDPSPAQEKP